MLPNSFTKITLFIISVNLFALIACNNSNDDKIREEALKSAEEAEKKAANLPHIATPEEVFPTDHIVPKAPPTTIDFAGKQRFEFGTIKEGEKITHDFEFKNTGKNPLTITNCKAACGCTVPEWEKTPIMPGETSKIHVIFNSEGKVGQQIKAVTVTANTEPQQTIITMSGMVEKVAK